MGVCGQIHAQNPGVVEPAVELRAQALACEPFLELLQFALDDGFAVGQEGVAREKEKRTVELDFRLLPAAGQDVRLALAEKAINPTQALLALASLA
jgi:hypothetical protein